MPNDFRISFKPSDIGVEEFLLKCCVDYLQEPLTIGITTKCYEVEVLASCILPNGKKIILNTDFDNVINLEDVSESERYHISYEHTNLAFFNFFYRCFRHKKTFYNF